MEQNNDKKDLPPWLEYIKIIYWAFKKPEEKKLVEIPKPAKDEINKKYSEMFLNVKDKGKEYFDVLEKFIKDRLIEEENRRTTLESKAHTVLGQTSVTTTLLLALFSISLYVNNFTFPFKILIYFFFILLLFHFICSALHAGRVVDPFLKETQIVIDTFQDPNISKNNMLLEKFYVSESLAFVNDIRAAFLTCALKCLKISFIIMAFGSLLFILFLLFNSNLDTSSNQINTINHIIVNDSSLQPINTMYKKDSSNILKARIKNFSPKNNEKH